MNTCPTCGRQTSNGSVYFIRETGIALLAESIVVNGKPIRLTPCEYVVAKMMFNRIDGEPVSVKDLIWELYAYHGPNYAEECVKKFILRLRRKLKGTDLSVRCFRPKRYGYVEARKAA